MVRRRARCSRCVRRGCASKGLAQPHAGSARHARPTPGRFKGTKMPAVSHSLTAQLERNSQGVLLLSVAGAPWTSLPAQANKAAKAKALVAIKAKLLRQHCHQTKVHACKWIGLRHIDAVLARLFCVAPPPSLPPSFLGYPVSLVFRVLVRLSVPINHSRN